MVISNFRRQWVVGGPLPPLRPKRAACGVAGLRSGSGQGQAQHALMGKSLARNHAEAIPLNI
jgi:hypothetical protein